MISTSETSVRIKATPQLRHGQSANTRAGSIIISVAAIFVAAFLLFKSERKKAAVGRRCVTNHPCDSSSTDALY